MFKLIETLRSKPSDKNIRIIRIVFASILIGVLYFWLPNTYWNYSSIPKEALYMLYIFPLIGIIRWVFDPGVMRKKLWKWTLVILGIIMMILSLFLIETQSVVIPEVPRTSSGEISAVDLVSAPLPSRWVDADFWIGFFWFWLTLIGLTLSSKNITTKNERYGEKVKKIRV